MQLKAALLKTTLLAAMAASSLATPQFALADAKPEIIGRLTQPVPDPSGIAVSSSNRVFLGFPRHADNHSWYALGELKNNKVEPYPDNKLGSVQNGNYQDWLVSPHGMYIDKNDVLWILDDGKRAGEQEIPEGAAKVIGIDTKTNKVVHKLIIRKPVLNSGSHYNDLRVDLSHGSQGTVYIANSGFKEHFSLVVIDIATDNQKEVLVNHYSTSPDAGFVAFLEGKPHKYDFKNQTFPLGGADGIAISPNNKTLYWTALSGRNLYSVPTAILSNFSQPESNIEKSVKFEGQHPANDGLAEDEKGNIYFGAFEQESLVKRDPAGNYSLIAHDEKNFGWPDGLAYKNHYLYVTLGQWNRLADLNGGKDLRKPPFLVMRVKVD